ncbi:PEBP-like protein [Hyaloscypha bicolor E]|uniref:PEBP-like protein n=1 Tax=Hyaloscypha bicolor E TaxID=1095630 RepID=A0A2J6T0I7_9HELO|nr:PEBP-like protein [Hyaloscypha bicolor E]PMD56527.1 PEBP-like protein [Hyaloscypha bicolor E]
MRVNFLKILLLIIGAARLRASLTSPEHQKLIGQSQSVFDTVRKALKRASIIDEVIDDFEVKCLVAPYYGKKERAVALGNVFKESTTKEKPSVKIYCPHIKSTPGLTIALTDPDAPSREDPKWSEMCHWIAIIPTSSQDGFENNLGDSADAKELVKYKPPSPPTETGYQKNSEKGASLT